MRVAANLVGRPGRDHLAELEDDDPVADVRARGPCRGRSAASTCRRRRSRRSRWPSSRSRSCRGRRPARRGRGAAARVASARATPTSLRCPGSAPSASLGERAEVEQLERLAPRRRSRRRACRPARRERRTDGRWAATVRFSRTVRSSNSSIALPGAGEPAPGPRVRRQPGEIAPVELDAAGARTKPVIASMNVVLPAPFGPISPTSCPCSTSRSTPSTARTPPKRTERPVVARTGAHVPLAGSDSASSAFRFARACAVR